MDIGDLVTDLDLLALDVQAATDFGGSSLADKRTVAVHEWLRPQLEQAGYQPWRHRSRRVCDTAWAYRGGLYVDIGGELADHDGDALPVNSLWPAPSADAVYLGLREPFRGLYVGQADAVNSTAGVASICYWNGTWRAFGSLVDGTKGDGVLSFAQAGRLTWSRPDDWFARALNGTFGYYVRVQVSSPCAPAAWTHVAALATSRLTYPVARYALSLLYAEGVGGSRGRWAEKSELFATQAQTDLDRVLPLLRDEFDVDESDTVDRVEASSVTPTASTYTWERG
jgi:hypothetical protein